MNPVLTRFVLTSPIWLPMLACAATTDFILFPYYRYLGCEPAMEITKTAWKVMGV